MRIKRPYKYRFYQRTDKQRKHDKIYQRERRKNNQKLKYREYKKWVKEHPEALKAYYLFHKALENKIIKRSACVVCGRKDTHGHHQDYKKPYDVIWLCPIHHKIIHQK